MQKIWQENKWLANVAVVNKVGGGGALASSYVIQHAADAHYLAIVRRALQTNHMLGRSTLNYTDMTPLASVGSEWMALTVRADSPVKSVRDLVERLRADPQSVSAALGSSRGGTPDFVLALVARTGGVEPRKLKVVTFGGAAESVTHLLGGHIDMMTVSVDNVLPHYRSGAMRVLGISSPQRSALMPDVPTLREQGYDVVMGGFVAIMGAKGLTPPQVAYWEGILERTANHADWKRVLEADALEVEFIKGQALRDYLRKEYDVARGLLVEMGMVVKQ